MLSKILAGKSIFTQILISIIFLVLIVFLKMPSNPEWDWFLGVFFLMMNSLVAILFLNNSNLINLPSFGVFFFMSWIFLFSGIVSDYKIAISFFMTTLLFWRFVEAEKSPENKKYLFDIGVLLSIAGFFYPPAFLLLAFLLLVFIYKFTLTLKGFLLFIIGLTLPILMGVQLLYLTDKLEWLEEFQTAFDLNLWSTEVWWLIPFVGLTLISWFDHLKNLSAQDLNKKHYYFLTFIYFVTWLLILFLLGGDKVNLLFVLGLPFAVFFSRFTQYFKSRQNQEIFLWLYSISVLAYYFQDEIVRIYLDLWGNITL